MIYGAFLFLHGIVRWVVVLAAVNVLFRAWQGSSQGKPFEQVHRTSNIVFVATMHLNLLVGLVLYAALSPITSAAFADMGAAMKDPTLRFYVVEHIFGMLIAVILATVGSVRAKKAPDDATKHKRGLIFFGLAFVILMVSIPWPFRIEGASWIASLRF